MALESSREMTVAGVPPGLSKEVPEMTTDKASVWLI